MIVWRSLTSALQYTVVEDAGEVILDIVSKDDDLTLGAIKDVGIGCGALDSAISHASN